MKLNWFQKLLFGINILFILGLLFANLSSYFEPVSNKMGYLFGLSYPYFLVINLLFVLFWVYAKKLHFILSLAIILLGYSNVKNLVSFNWKKEIKTTSDFTIMSFNVRLFNVYKWIDDDTIDDQIIEYIDSEKPDIICFQEFFENKKTNVYNIKRMKEIGYSYYKKESKPTKNGYYFGLITFSKYKITESGIAHKKDDKNKVVSFFTDIKINEKTIRVYNTHLNSLGFKTEDYKFVENLTNNNEKEAIRKSKSILSKIAGAGAKRQEEVKHIIAQTDKSPYPFIVLGDFNEPPYSYAYPKFKKKLNDPFLKFGFGLGTTYDGISTLPGIRLDYILHSNELVSNSFSIGPKNLSDHRAVSASFTFLK